jgi:hypothetical protein
MEIEPLISGSKWSMIALLSEKSQSPTELAAKTGTSLANISQQLRLKGKGEAAHAVFACVRLSISCLDMRGLFREKDDSS